MKRVLVLTLVMLAAAARAGDPWTAMRGGFDAFARTNFAAAATNFAAAAATAPTEQLDPAVARYNEGTALLAAGQPAEAARALSEALRSGDLNLQQKAHFNRGNALMALSAAQEQAQKLDEAVKQVQEAQAMYENAMTLDPRDPDVKVNYELALQREQQLQELKQQQQQQQQNQDQNQDQEKQDQEKQGQQDKSEQQKSDDQQPQDQQQQDGQQQQDPQEQKPQEQPSQPQADKPQEQDAQQPVEAQPARPEEMTPEEARQLLDAMKKAEEAQRENVRILIGKPVPVEKDW